MLDILISRLINSSAALRAPRSASVALIMMRRKRRMSLLLTVVTDLYDGNRKSLSLELERQTEMTINQLTVEGLGRSGGMVEALQRVYRDGLRSHETLLRESLQRVEFIPINLQVPTEPSESGITAKVS